MATSQRDLVSTQTRAEVISSRGSDTGIFQCNSRCGDAFLVSLGTAIDDPVGGLGISPTCKVKSSIDLSAVDQ